MMPSSQQGQKQEVYSHTDYDMQYMYYARRQYIDLNIHDFKRRSLFSFFVAIIGVSIVFLGVVGSFLGLTSIAIVEVAGGTITSAVGMLVYLPIRDIAKRMKEIFDPLAERDRINSGLELAEKKLPVEARERIYENYIEGLLYRPSKDRKVLELPMGQQSEEKTPQSPTDLQIDANT